MTTTWTEAATAKSREALPRLQRALDAARVHLDDLRQRQEAVQRAAAALNPDTDSDLSAAVRVAAEVLPPMVAEAEAAVVQAIVARREARSALLPPDESPWSRLAAARQAERRLQGELDRARSQVGELQRGRAAALGAVREAGPGSNMVALAAAEAELRLSERALPGARDALAAAEEGVQRARAEVDAVQARTYALRGEVLTGEPRQAEAAVVELMSLVGDDPSGWLPR